MGVNSDIGGKNFVRGSRRIYDLLLTYASVTPDSRVLEIGCGCGRIAFALAEQLNDGNYVGMDVEKIALEGAKANLFLYKKGFKFDLLDVKNDAYNPEGKYAASEYIFPYSEKSFDVVFMISVFTHMLTDEVHNYTKEISRLLKPRGRCFLTSFLSDDRNPQFFPFRAQQHSYSNEAIPGLAVAYQSAFLVEAFGANGMQLVAGPVWGPEPLPEDEFQMRGQDIMVFAKE